MAMAYSGCNQWYDSQIFISLNLIIKSDFELFCIQCFHYAVKNDVHCVMVNGKTAVIKATGGSLYPSTAFNLQASGIQAKYVFNLNHLTM